jgi:hypothetical protein
MATDRKISIRNPRSKSPELIVGTPGGDIVVRSCGDPAYPDASIFVGGQCIGFLEWHPESKQFNFHYYGMSDDMPIQTFENVTDI